MGSWLDQPRAGLTNRSHVKTHKSPVLARMQRDAGARGITCQKLGEAEVMATESESEPRLDAGQGQMFKAV
jgi:hypothetical protein